MPSRSLSHHGTPALMGVLLAAFALALPPSTASAQDSPAPKPKRSPEQIERQKKRQAHKDFAGVFYRQVPPADAKLRLKVEGEARGKAHATYYLGLLKEEEGDVLGAVDYYSQVVTLDPSATILAARAAFLAGQYGEVEKGRTLLEQNLTANNDDPFSHLALADYLATYLADDKEGENKALATVQDAYNKFPEDPNIIDHLILMLVSWDRTRQAEDVLERALARDVKDPEYWLALGKTAQHVWSIPDVDTAEPIEINRIYEKALANPTGGRAISESVADYYHASGQDHLAEPIYRAIIDEDPTVIDPYEKLARIHLRPPDPDFEKAAEVLSDLLVHHPRLPGAQRLIANIYTDMANQLLTETRTAAETGDLEKADSLQEQTKGRFNQAIHHFEQALRIDPRGEGDYLMTGRLMIRVDRFQDSIDLFNRGLFHFPQSVPLTKWLAMASSYSEQFEEALPAFGKSIELADEQGDRADLDHSFYFQYAVSHERLKDFDQASELFRKAIALIPADSGDPELEEYYENFRALVTNYLGYMWIENDMNIDEAGELILEANALQPNNGAYVDSLGWYHFKKKEYQKALRELLRAETLIAEEGGAPDPVIHDHIGQAYFQTGNASKAIQYMEKAVELDPENEEFKERLDSYKKSLKTDPIPIKKPAPDPKKKPAGKSKAPDKQAA
ncbi:MAG: tetratricopeptide repeat protein [Verrucomicrobiota bacterium]